MDKNLPANAGSAFSIPVQGTRIPRASGKPGPCSSTRESPKPKCHNEDPAQPKKKKKDLTCLPWRKGKRHRADCSHNGCCTLLCKYIEDSASLEERRSAVFRGARKCFKYRI